ncbi:ABC transporter permease [Fibrella aquatilis]|uniref:ABC transporter permease n=1 Tax=Fibrella aquatilis TaxID=2817059 RepID=A0A939G794_9BACT|nr:ABC transporter permease [Fibrella aquatilis]MBO0931457.1 ABC transporter permease [Fibrella aquatilis]
MLQHYVIIASRALLKNKFFSLINLLGLAIGMTASMLILQYVSFEMVFDRFHRQGDNIYRVLSKGAEDADYSVAVNAPLGPALKADLPEIKDYTRFFNKGGLVRSGTEVGLFKEDRMLYADASFLKVFSFPLLSGTDSLALKAPNAAVVTRSFAKKCFGTTEAVGKTLVLIGSNTNYTYQVTGVAEDVPINSHIQFNVLLSLPSVTNRGGPDQQLDSWNWTVFHTYVVLSSNTTAPSVAAKLHDLLLKYGGQEKDKLALQPLKSIHLYSRYAGEIIPQGNIEVVCLLLYVALFTIIIAWINYVNLSTVRSSDRAREIGVKKVFGANQGQLARQFMIEAFLLNVLAFVLAIIITLFVRRYLDQLIGVDFTGFIMSSYTFWLLMLALILMGALASGAYPAFMLSSLKPVEIIEGKMKSNLRGGTLFRNGLVILQFAASVTLLIGTFTIYKQVNFLRSANLNISIDQIVVVKGPVLNRPKEQESYVFDRFKTALAGYSFVDKVAVTNPFPGGGISWIAIGFKRADMTLNKNTKYNVFYADKDFFTTYDVKFLAGGGYRSKNGVFNGAQEIILNKTAAQLMGFSLPAAAIDQHVNNGMGDCVIVGVIDDYFHESLKKSIDPLVVMLNTSYDYYSIRLKTNLSSSRTLERLVSELRTEYERSYPGDLFDYFFLNEYFDKKYREDVRFGIMFGMFSLLAVVVACIGLLGLAAFTVAKRTREVAIRKVLGASNQEITVLLGKEFILLIGAASLIACPVAYLLLNKWLENFAQRIGLNWLFFATPIVVMLTLSMATVMAQVIKIARATAVSSLRQN